MEKLFRGIKSIIAILEIVGAVLSAILFILEKIGVMKKNTPQNKENK